MSGVSEAAVFLNFLRDQTTFPFRHKIEPTHAVRYTSSILEVFGQRYAPAIKAKLGPNGALFTQLHRVYHEILSQPEKPYNETDFPKTKNFIDQHKTASRGPEHWYLLLKPRAYQLLPFPQAALTQGEDAKDILAKIESVKQKAFSCLMQMLSVEAEEEKKGNDSPLSKVLSEEEELALTQLYYKDGALMWEGKAITFSDLVEQWQVFNDKNSKAKSRLVMRLTARLWTSGTDKNDPIPEFDKHKGVGSFKDYLIQCSVDALEKNLGFSFPPFLVETFKNAFKNETIRSDVCYFTSQLPQFYEMDLSLWGDRRSASLLRSLQLFLFLVRTKGIRPEDRGSFLRMLIHRDEPLWKVESFPGFEQRKWPHPALNQEEERWSRARIEYEKNLGENLTQLSQAKSWNQFYSYYALEVMQESLGFSFTDSLKEFLLDKLTYEKICPEILSSFTDLPSFYERDLSTCSAEAASLLKSLQLFLFFVRSRKIKEENKSALLEMILRNPKVWKPELVQGFENRSWSHQPVEIEDLSFEEAWRGIEQLLPQPEKRLVSFSQPSCGSLLFFLWQNERRNLFINLFTQLTNNSHFSLNLSQMLQFCLATHASMNEETSQLLCKKYQEVIEALKEKGIEIQNAEVLFIDPPPSNLQDSAFQFCLNRAGQVARQFVNSLSPYGFAVNKNYLILLRKFIFKWEPHLFELLKDAPALGIKSIDEDFLWKVLSIEHEFIDEQSLTQEIRLEAQAKAAKLRMSYPFSDQNVFFLYLEFIRLLIAERGEIIGNVSLFVNELQSFCPFLHPEIFYFLFRYHPDIDLEKVSALFHLRNEWALSDDSHKFAIPKAQMEGLFNPFYEFVDDLAKACPNDSKNKFEVTLKHAFQAALFPPLQPLVDHFRISNLTVGGGIRWKAADLITHLGQLKPVLGTSDLRVYLHWSIFKDKPTFFLSFFDLKKGTAYSSFESLNVSAAEVSSEAIRVPFYTLLFSLTQTVFKEEVDKDPETDDPKPETWLPCYTGATEEIERLSEAIEDGRFSQDYVDSMLNFIQRVKLSYRTLFLAAAGARGRPSYERATSSYVAAQGHIFDSHPRGCLLPAALLNIESQAADYLPDADAIAIDASQRLFKIDTSEPTPLNLNLRVEGKDIPLFYQVQTAEMLEKSDSRPQEGTWTRHHAAPGMNEVQGKYVTLSTEGGIRIPLRYPQEVLESPYLFQRYFDYQTLLVKAASYLNRLDDNR